MKYLRKIIGVLFLLFILVGCAKEEPAYIEVTVDDSTFENKFYY